ncbi:fatty acid desaturase [Cytobacillus gottheilii]|uniref:fatty acid desaturase n=1 Tax=Cytobacillus gottheilii TaxID=859144 RepID=UPI0009B97847|nr:fatty acid desaturase [Cytobacillus gottheilii]
MTKQLLTSLKKEMAPFEKANRNASIRQLLNTLIPFFALWYGAYLSLEVSYLLTLALSVIASGFLVRIFIIFHDCCHNSFFKNKKANKIIGTITGVITLFPFSQWQRDHSIHHATSSNLDKRGTGDIWVLTVQEYIDAPFWTKVGYRLYRNPIIMFGLGPIYQFLIVNRFNRKDAKWKERLNTYITNVSIVALYSGMCWLIGWEAFLLVQLPIFLLSGSAGIWLFYIQHTFEQSYFEVDSEWEYVKAAVEGSSYYKLPKILQWLTGNIGFHHVHHLSPRVPNYLLEEAHNESEALQHAPTITIAKSLESLRFKLWDEENKNFVGYKAVKTFIQKSNNVVTDKA